MTELAVLTERVKFFGETLVRIEKKLDTAQDDHEMRLRKIAEDVSDHANRVTELERQSADRETRMRRLEESDRRWAAFAIVASAVLSVLGRLLIP